MADEKERGTRVISIHEYELAHGVSEDEFARAVRAAKQRGLLDLPGLLGHHFVKGLKGRRKDQFAAIWVYESRAAWEQLWGPPDAPKPRNEHPERWRQFEDEVLAPLINTAPDSIDYTTYEELQGL
jgi:heme-degrading monooxygenase HmoA